MKEFEDSRGEEYIAKFRDVYGETSMMTPEEVANITFQAIREEKLYIIIHKDTLMKRMVKERFIEILKVFEE